MMTMGALTSMQPLTLRLETTAPAVVMTRDPDAARVCPARGPVVEASGQPEAPVGAGVVVGAGRGAGRGAGAGAGAGAEPPCRMPYSSLAMIPPMTVSIRVPDWIART